MEYYSNKLSCSSTIMSYSNFCYQILKIISNNKLVSSRTIQPRKTYIYTKLSEPTI